MRTIAQLISDGVIKTKSYKMLNAVIDCHTKGGIKGLWINNKYYKAVPVLFEEPVFDVGKD